MADSNDDRSRVSAEQAETGLELREDVTTAPVSVHGAADHDNVRQRAAAPVEAVRDGVAEIASGVNALGLRVRTAADIAADIDKAENRLMKAEADKEKYETVADDPSKTPKERARANRRLDATIDTIKNITRRLASLQNDLRNVSAAQPAPQLAPPVFGTLEELILAMGGKSENGAVRLNMLEPSPNSLDTTFRARTNELATFASCIASNLSMAASDRAEHRPFYVTTALPGTGKTTFARECLARLPAFLESAAQQVVRDGLTIYLNLNGGSASWHTDTELRPEARLVARLVSNVFLRSPYQSTWSGFSGLLTNNKGQLSFVKLVPLIARALRLRNGLGPDAKVSALLVLDEFQHLGKDLSHAVGPLLTVMGDSSAWSRCYDSDGILVLPYLTGTSLNGASSIVEASGHSSRLIVLEPFSEADSFAKLVELFQVPTFALPRALLEHFAPALDAAQPFEALAPDQLCFRGLVLDCGGNPALLVHVAAHLVEYCRKSVFSADSRESVDGLFSSFKNAYSHWSTATKVVATKISALPNSLVPIVVASLPIYLDQPAVDGKGKAMAQTWSQLLSSCGLTPIPHPSFPYRWLVQIPYVFLSMMARATGFVPLAACVDFPYLYRSGQAFEKLVFRVHAQRTFHLLGTSALAIGGVVFQQLFPGGFVPAAIGECLVRLPNETAEREGGPQYKTENGWCHYVRGTVDDVPPSALSGDVYNTSDINHHHFEGRSALQISLDVRQLTWTTVLLLWQTKLSQPGSKSTFGLADVREWHTTARTLTKSWTDAGMKVVFVLVLFRNLSAATTAKKADAVREEVRKYAQASGDLVVVTKEHMGEYLAGLAHRLYVPLESTSTATA